MKKLLALILVLSMLALCGCSGTPETTDPSTVPTEATSAPTTAATQTPTEPSVPVFGGSSEPEETLPAMYTNPLTGETIDAPITNRIFAVTINNVPAAMPHYGVSKADIYFEMFINDHATRGLALYADITEAESIGSVRSLRYNFTDIAQSFDAIVVYAGGSNPVLNDLYQSGVSHIYAEGEVHDYHYRDYDRLNSGYYWEHCLFVRGPELLEYAQSKGMQTGLTRDSYGFTFAEDATPENGENASTVTINMIHDGVTKTTTMVYDEATGLYGYNQYKNPVMDDVYDVQETFKNVIVMFCKVYNSDVYHVAELSGEGDGYFACNGKIIPIKWSHADNDDDFHFTLTDGTPLELGIGSTYISVAPLTSNVVWE